MAHGVVLVAEDEIAIRAMIAEYLKSSGFEVLQASNAEAALALIASRPVDLVFSDVNMPGKMKGDEMAEWLAAHKPQLPVILTSGLARPVKARRFISKPYCLDEVEHQIRELLH